MINDNELFDGKVFAKITPEQVQIDKLREGEIIYELNQNKDQNYSKRLALLHENFLELEAEKDISVSMKGLNQLLVKITFNVETLNRLLLKITKFKEECHDQGFSQAVNIVKYYHSMFKSYLLKFAKLESEIKTLLEGFESKTKGKATWDEEPEWAKDEVAWSPEEEISWGKEGPVTDEEGDTLDGFIIKQYVNFLKPKHKNQLQSLIDQLDVLNILFKELGTSKAKYLNLVLKHLRAQAHSYFNLAGYEISKIFPGVEKYSSFTSEIKKYKKTLKHYLTSLDNFEKMIDSESDKEKN
jgi:hypothetical protein